jgi:hypothetical protein
MGVVLPKMRERKAYGQRYQEDLALLGVPEVWNRGLGYPDEAESRSGSWRFVGFASDAGKLPKATSDPTCVGGF